MREQPLLIGDVGNIFLDIFRIAFKLGIGTAFHFVNGPSVVRLAQNIYSTIVALIDERSLADVLHAFGHPLARLFGHGGEVKAAVSFFGMRFLVIAEESHC